MALKYEVFPSLQDTERQILFSFGFLQKSKTPSWLETIIIIFFFLTSRAWEEAGSGTSQSRPNSE